MQTQDYIRRQIELIAQFVARILGLRTQQPEDAVREADRALSELTGFPLSMILRLGTSGLRSTLGRERSALLVPLFRATAEALQDAGRESDARGLSQIAAELEQR